MARIGAGPIAAIICIAGSSPALAAGECTKLAGNEIPPSAIGLPTRGAVIIKASEFPASGDLPATCRINGEIRAAAKGSPAIRFQINLPAAWNGKALQLGGAGFNGMLVDGLRGMPGNGEIAKKIPNPLARGFITFGSDGGHIAASPMDSSFGRDAEARENYMGAAVKRLRDTAVAVIKVRYGRAPKRVYYAGGSKGGHEGLVAAQRYGADFDGVISYFPAKDSVGLILSWGALTEAAYGPGGTPISTTKLAFVRRSVITACDGLDGLNDGVIANIKACEATISPVSLLCKSGHAPSDDCLTAGEAATLSRATRRTQFPFPLANGLTEGGPFPVMSEANIEPAWLSANGRQATMYDAFVKGIVRDFWEGDASAGLGSTDLLKLRSAIVAHSQASEATSTDLEAFAAHGGKLILVQGTTDMLVPPAATTDYFLRLAARYGDRTPSIAKYFVQPGYGHGQGPFTLAWDSLAALDTWVETGKFPASPTATDANRATRDRTMPLCEYPLFPRYKQGDRKKASSYYCTGV